jgi:uncharacterized membrane protein
MSTPRQTNRTNIFQALQQHGRLELSLLLAAMTLFCIALSFFRLAATDSFKYMFLNKNILLAFIPWAITTFLIIRPELQSRKTLVVVLMISWMLFFPNAPYILTDLFHLQFKSRAPIWYDLLLILSFAWTGLLYGIMSLMDIEKLLITKAGKRWTPIIISVILFLGSFGIYLGRYLRWNSWDIVQNPMPLVMDVIDRFIDPFSHPRTWGMTIMMGVLLNAMYWSVKLLRRSHQVPAST